MEVTESIPRAALDTLSGQVAVLDESGTILFTNSEWGTVDGQGTSPERDGVNYFDSVDPTGDDYAADAVQGIRDVLDGERESFRLEYPCHTADTKRWFLMRVTAFTLGQDRFATVTHIDITDRRLAELEAADNAAQAERERRRLERLVDHINGLVQDVTRLLVEADSRSDIEEGTCQRLAEDDAYVYAWLGDADFSRDTLAIRAAAGEADATLDDAAFPLSADDETVTPTVEAFQTRTTQLVRGIDPDSRLADIYGPEVESVVAVPLVTRETCYGVLTVCGGEPTTFDERERAVLQALARAVANGRNALESRQTLTTNHVVELSFTVEDQALFPVRLSSVVDRPLSYSGSVYDNGNLRLFYRVEGSTDRILTVAAADDAVIEAGKLAEYDDESLIQFTLEDSLISTLADRGAVTNSVTATDGEATYTIELSQEADARGLFEHVSDRYEGTELVEYHEHERPVQTRQKFRSDLQSRLTDRQLTALKTAYHSGFFDWPRGVDGDELAEMMGISRSTFHQHLRVAERKVFEAFLDGH